MFKFAHKISSYGDESRVDFNLSKRKLNCRFKDKVLYLKDQTVFWKDIDRHKFWYKYVNYIFNDEYDYFDNKFKINIFYRKYHKPALIKQSGYHFWYKNGIEDSFLNTNLQ